MLFSTYSCQHLSQRRRLREVIQRTPSFLNLVHNDMKLYYCSVSVSNELTNPILTETGKIRKEKKKRMRESYRRVGLFTPDGQVGPRTGVGESLWVVSRGPLCGHVSGCVWCGECKSSFPHDDKRVWDVCSSRHKHVLTTYSSWTRILCEVWTVDS